MEYDLHILASPDDGGRMKQIFLSEIDRCKMRAKVLRFTALQIVYDSNFRAFGQQPRDKI